MKRTVISAVILIAGVIQTIGIILAAILSMPQMNSWSNDYPSRIWFLIFAGNSQYGDGANGLGLGIFMIFGIAMILFGTVALMVEYFKKN